MTGEMAQDAPYRRQTRDQVKRAKQLNQARVAFSNPYPCTGCGRAFRHPSALATHRRMKAH